MTKVIVIGLDGLEPKITEAMLNDGQLPNLDKLRQQGEYTRVRTTFPPQTPVAWSSFTTGTNPGGHGIFDFLSRDPKTYLPALSLSRYEQKNMFVMPKAVNLRHGVPFWELLSEAGIPSTILRCPCTYPPDKIEGRMLAGVGVPDLRGGLGSSTFYTSGKDFIEQESEKVIQVQINDRGIVDSYLIGPRNPKKGENFHLNFTLHLETSVRKAVLRSDGQPNALELKEGQWSDWLKVKFKLSMFQSVQGIVRFYLGRLEPELELYASPINFDPASPLFPISDPPDYASELETRLGTFYTAGMAEDHDGLIHGRFNEEAYLDQCRSVMKEREKMMLYELERFQEGFFFCLFDTPDRIQHMFWRFFEDDHPANDSDITNEMQQVIFDHYRDCDAIVGKVLEFVDDDSLLIVLSDHGMNSFQRGIHLNTWLYDHGWLSLNAGYKPGEETGNFFRNVDWSNTKAYALGLGGIFINLKGREEMGIVDTADVQNLKRAIAQELTGLGDPERDRIAVRSVVASDQVYKGPYTENAPDLLVNFAPGYRVSWGTPLGGTPAGLFEDNTRKWGGDHMLDPALVPGVLFMNQSFQTNGAHLIDLAPTILDAFGMKKGPLMEGDSLLL